MCPPGYSGLRCERPCPPGKWGESCQRSCLCQNNAACDPINGTFVLLENKLFFKLFPFQRSLQLFRRFCRKGLQVLSEYTQN